MKTKMILLVVAVGVFISMVSLVVYVGVQATQFAFSTVQQIDVAKQSEAAQQQFQSLTGVNLAHCVQAATRVLDWTQVLEQGFEPSVNRIKSACLGLEQGPMQLPLKVEANI